MAIAYAAPMHRDSYRTAQRLGALVLVGAAMSLYSAACGGDPDLSDPEEAGVALGEALCGYLAGCCEAGVLPGGSEGACVEQISANFKFAIDQGESEGYTYDPRCVETQITVLENAECSPNGLSQTQSAGSCVATCYGGFVHGTAKQGEACDDPRDCDFGLQCMGTCVDPCGAQVGERCGNVGETFVVCRIDGFCKLDEGDPNQGTCTALPKRGEDCTSSVCTPGLACIDGSCADPQPNGAACRSPNDCFSKYCDPTDPQNPVCGEAPGPGQACSYACTPDAVCNGETCIALPKGGEACPGSQCAPGFLCRDEVCVSESELLCSTFTAD